MYKVNHFYSNCLNGYSSRLQLSYLEPRIRYSYSRPSSIASRFYCSRRLLATGLAMHQLSPKSVLFTVLDSPTRHSSMSSGLRLSISSPSQEMKDLRLLAGVPILRVWGEMLEFV